MSLSVTVNPISQRALMFNQTRPQTMDLRPQPPREVPGATQVSISNEASLLFEQEQATKQPLSKTEMQAVYYRTHGPNTWTDVVVRQINADGKSAAVLQELPDSSDPDRLAIARQAATYVYYSYTNGDFSEAGNPFIDLSQHELSAIVYDESGNYTQVERYAALSLRHERNQATLAKIGNLIFNPDERLFLRGVLDYHDALSPIEQSMYPDGHRETWQGFLDEAELKYGKLEFKSLLQLLAEQAELLKPELLP